MLIYALHKDVQVFLISTAIYVNISLSFRALFLSQELIEDDPIAGRRQLQEVVETPLMLQNCFFDFAVEYRLGCRTTEPSFAGDIGAIES